MSGTEPDIQVTIKGRGEQAILSLPDNLDPEFVTGSTLCCYAEAQSVEMTEAIRTRLQEIAEQYRENPPTEPIVIAEAVPPVHGSDGCIEWVEGYDPTPEPESTENASESDEENATVDHYQGQKFVQVDENVHVATMIEPTDGEDGRNVLGESIPARAGKPCSVAVDQSLLVDAQGKITTQAEGVLKLQNNVLSVTKLLEVNGDVNFKTGHIDFEGSVNIKDGVRDRFEVKARGCVQVGGLVEAAKIICTGDFICRRGVASRDRGRIAVGGNAEIGFLNNVRGNIHGDLNSRREIINCELVIGGDLHCSRGSVIGGLLIVGGGIEVGKLGSDGHTPTVVRLGEVPVLSTKVKRLKSEIAASQKQLEIKRDRERVLHQAGSCLNPKEKEESTEIKYEIDEIESRIEEMELELEEVKERIQQSRKVNVQISQMLYSKVVFRLGQREIHVTKDVKGPIQIGWSEDRQLVYRIVDGPLRSITEIGRVTIVGTEGEDSDEDDKKGRPSSAQPPAKPKAA
ncbi:MAG: DUF342 domain-containing protein [Phycisphaerales bacterium]|nr:MAG: DUF342 domain-containing protein [Phycisphaerales bacterium]